MQGTETPKTEAKPEPMKFSSKKEMETYIWNEFQITAKQYEQVMFHTGSIRIAVLAFYQWANRAGLRMDKVSELQRRDAFVNGFAIALAGKEKTDVSK